MAIAFNCSACAAPMKVGDNLAGKKVKCPKCAAVNVVPTGEEEAAAAGIATEPDAADDADDGKGKKGKKAKGKKGKMGLLIAGGLAVLALGFFTCLCGGGGLTLYFGFPEYLPSFLGGRPSELKYMPTGTTTISLQRIDQQRNSKFYKDVDAAKPASMKKFEADYEKAYGIATSNVDCILEGGSGTDHVSVVTAKSSVKSADVLSKLKDSSKQEYEEEKAGSYTIQKPKGAGGQAFCVAGSKTVVFSRDPKTLKAVLERDKMPEFSAAMQNAMKKASFGKTEVHISAGSEAGLGFGGFGGKKDLKPDFMVRETDLGSDMKMRTVASFKDASDANDAKKLADDEVLKQKGELEKKGLANEVTVSVSVSGNILTQDVRMTSKVLIEMFKESEKFMPK